MAEDESSSATYVAGRRTDIVSNICRSEKNKNHELLIKQSDNDNIRYEVHMDHADKNHIS